MVAPYEVGEPVRSFVRVPTEGREAKALCWDISRTSSVAVPPALAQPRVTPLPVVVQDHTSPSKPRQEQASADSSPLSPANQQLPPRQRAASPPNERKRLREEEEEREGEEGTSQPSIKVARTAEAAPVSPAQSQQGLAEELQQLQQQCKKLRQENENLQQRLSQFRSLFQDRRLLGSFLRRLDTLVK